VSSVTARAARAESQANPCAVAQTPFIRGLLFRPSLRTAQTIGTNGSTQMGDEKIQGEGDYESARRYRQETERFVKEHTRDDETIRGNADEATDELTPAEREGLSHARDGDERDAEVMRELDDRPPTDQGGR
jgi:hypothetical protein